ncbi:MAG: RHS repeat-associated core domain-containing protein, partial [Thermoguttaceae bacterium]
MAENMDLSPSTPETDGPLYAGYFFDAETRLYLARNRYYNSSTAAWINRDPIGYKGGLNLYEYCGDNPTNRTDPSGLQLGDFRPSPPGEPDSCPPITISPSHPPPLPPSPPSNCPEDCAKALKACERAVEVAVFLCGIASNPLTWEGILDPEKWTTRIDRLDVL